MVFNNPLFSKENLKRVADHLDQTSFTLIYDSNDLPQQINAGKELRQTTWIIATIADHIFDYYPYTYFLNDDDQKEYPKYIKWFLGHPYEGIEKAEKYIKNNFSAVETITRDEYNQHRIPKRDLEKEADIIAFFDEIKNNIDEIIDLLNKPKKITDPSKPSAELIKELISKISQLQNIFCEMADKSSNKSLSTKAFEISKIFEIYKLPLYMAWQVYHYGWHSDFWKEGDSMFEYMMFEMKPKEIINDMLTLLEKQSPFAQVSDITNGLKIVYKHLLNQLDSNNN